MLLMPADLCAAFEGAVQAVETGAVAEERLNESVRRILTLKEKAGVPLGTAAPASAEEPAAPETTEEAVPEKPSDRFGWLRAFWN